MEHKGSLWPRGNVQLAVFCPGGVNTTLWDLARQERGRGSAEARPAAAFHPERRMGQLKRFFGTMTPVDDAAATFFADLERGRFICDSVPGLAADVFGRRSAYVLGGKRPSEMRAKL